jgi:hypothetical protein
VHAIRMCAEGGCSKPVHGHFLFCAKHTADHREAQRDQKMNDQVDRKCELRTSQAESDTDWRQTTYARAYLQRPFTLFPTTKYTTKRISKDKWNTIKPKAPEHYPHGLWPIEFRCAHVELKIDLERALAFLTPRQRTIICMRFGIGEDHEFELAPIAQGLRLCKESVRRIEAQVLRALRRDKVTRRLLQPHLFDE